MTHGRFLTELDARHIGSRRKKLLADLVYEDARGRRWVVPAGSESDGASVPRLLWWLYPPFGESYEPATWLHDELYRNAEHHLVEGDDGKLRPINRGEADALMEEVSLACGFRNSGANVMHFGVRAGGRRTWNKHRRAAKARELEAA